MVAADPRAMWLILKHFPAAACDVADLYPTPLLGLRKAMCAQETPACKQLTRGKRSHGRVRKQYEHWPRSENKNVHKDNAKKYRKVRLVQSLF